MYLVMCKCICCDGTHNTAYKQMSCEKKKGVESNRNGNRIKETTIYNQKLETKREMLTYF